MSYGELLRALSAEAARDAAAVVDGASREAERIHEAARQAAAAAREVALAQAGAAERTTLARTRAQAARQVEAAVLTEARRRLEALRAEALATLRGRARALLPRLADELCALARPGPAVLLVDPGDEEVVREHVARAHPDLAPRLEVRAAAAARGGLELRQEGVVLDDTLAARLERAWPGLEPALATLLFGDPGPGDGAQ